MRRNGITIDDRQRRTHHKIGRDRRGAIHGRCGDFVDFAKEREVAGKPNWHFVLLYEYGSDPSTHPVKANTYFTQGMDDNLDKPIYLHQSTIVPTTVLNLDVTKVAANDFASLTAGIGRASASLNAGQSFLGGLASEVEGQQRFNSILSMRSKSA